MGVVIAAGVAVAGYLIITFYVGPELHRFVDEIREELRSADQRNSFTNHGFGVAGPSLVFDAIAAVSLAGQVLLMIWLHRAATVARRAGLPARREPMWAWLGFLVPVVNFWFPYQVAADVLPPEHPARRRGGGWWACWVAQGFVTFVIMVASYFSRTTALLLTVGLSAVPAAAAVHARAMITATVATHRRILGLAPTPS